VPETGLGTEPSNRSEFADRGWVVLLLATLTAALTGPGQTLGVSVFIDSFVDDLSLTRSQVSSAYLVGTLVAASLLPRIGSLIDARGVRRAQVAIGALFALALVNMSLVNGLIWLTIGFCGIRLLGQGSLSLVSTVTVSISFVRNRGSALGLFSMGSAGGMALIPVGLAVVISSAGWRVAWLVAAGFVLVTVVPMAWFGLRRLPAGTKSQSAADAVRLLADNSFERSEALRTRSFWMLAAVSTSSGMLSTALVFHQIDLLGDAGISKTAAAALFLPQVLGSTIAGLGFGLLADRVGIRFLPAAGMALLIAAMLLAAIAAPGLIAVVYAIVLGAMGGGVRTLTATLLPTWFGAGHLGSIQGFLTFLTVGSTAVGPVVLAVAEGWLGSYPPAILVLTVIPVAALLFSLGSDQRRRVVAAS
jgi:MFS family permease